MNQAPPSAPLTDGLSSIDRDRAGSMADEGGASAATVEAEGTLPAASPPELSSTGLFVFLAAAAVTLLVVALTRRS